MQARWSLWYHRPMKHLRFFLLLLARPVLMALEWHRHHQWELEVLELEFERHHRWEQMVVMVEEFRQRQEAARHLVRPGAREAEILDPSERGDW